MAALPGDVAPATQWHQDRITVLPEGATVLLENDVCVQGFRVGSAYGLQLHPEIDAELFAWWADATDPQDEALVRSGVDLAEAVATVAGAQGALAASWEPVTRAWAALVLERARAHA